MGGSVTTVLFDLDETLCEQRRPGADVLSEAFALCGLAPFFSFEEYVAAVREVGGTESDVARRERCFESLAVEAGRDAEVGRRLALVYEGLRDYTDVRCLPGAEAVLDAFADRYRLGLVTNGGPDTQSVKIDALGLRDRFESIVLAGYETPPKPAPDGIELAMADLNAAPSETVYVGNNPLTDVAGANAAGVDPVWIPYGSRRAVDGESGAAYAVESIGELRDPPWL